MSSSFTHYEPYIHTHHTHICTSKPTHTHTHTPHTHLHKQTHPHTHTHTHTQLKLDNTTCYKINGLILIPIFFVARILNIPLAFLAYAAQYHSWDIWTAIKSMTLFCHFCNVGQWLLQLYWFTAIIGIVTGAVRTYVKTKWS